MPPPHASGLPARRPSNVQNRKREAAKRNADRRDQRRFQRLYVPIQRFMAWLLAMFTAALAAPTGPTRISSPQKMECTKAKALHADVTADVKLSTEEMDKVFFGTKTRKPCFFLKLCKNGFARQTFRCIVERYSGQELTAKLVTSKAFFKAVNQAHHDLENWLIGNLHVRGQAYINSMSDNRFCDPDTSVMLTPEEYATLVGTIATNIKNLRVQDESHRREVLQTVTQLSALVVLCRRVAALDHKTYDDDHKRTVDAWLNVTRQAFFAAGSAGTTVCSWELHKCLSRGHLLKAENFFASMRRHF
eukprot:m.85159 g.85159  ORF g.85159 m.85159 type:complete len:304 (-) comp14832_c0_seq1:417-1328(-)